MYVHMVHVYTTFFFFCKLPPRVSYPHTLATAQAALRATSANPLARRDCTHDGVKHGCCDSVVSGRRRPCGDCLRAPDLLNIGRNEPCLCRSAS